MDHSSNIINLVSPLERRRLAYACAGPGADGLQGARRIAWARIAASGRRWPTDSVASAGS
jgi:hypothetical protein